MDRIAELARAFAQPVIGFDLRFSLFYLGATVLLAFLIWLWRGQRSSFLVWLLPAKVYLHRSNLVDFKLFLANHAMFVSGIFGPVIFAPAIAYLVASALNAPGLGDPGPLAPTWIDVAIATAAIVVATDFCKYWAHRLHHETRFLWPFHAVHHSAEVLTPLTLARAHPMETVVRNLIVSIVVGLVQGLLLFLLIGEIDILTVGGANILYFLFNLLGANLRHSHIWLSYGYVAEHIFISPAQHQIHHSVAVEHHNKNYGSIFALWDWAFGTLYIPDAQEDLTFGVSNAAGDRIEQPHPTLRAALLAPFAESAKAFRRSRRPSGPSAVKHPAE
ncbi:MAG: sterol desaturase family protein [Rhodobacter sp.]|nr:sterol desaturase family protein [Rhodobacter sp.]